MKKQGREAGKRPQKSAAQAVTDISQHKFLFHKGTNYRSYEFLGVHKLPGKKGYVFRVWAPRAIAIALVGDFNQWDVTTDPMRPLEDDDSIWEITVKNAKEGDLYKFAITSDDGKVTYKADPFAFCSESGTFEEGNQRASVIWDYAGKYKFKDEKWLKYRNNRNPYRSPMNIYEVHLGSWRHHEDDTQLSYRELADTLIPYVADMGYTDLELLPITEYPFEGSWGYQVTGYYSVTSRFGTPDDFRYFVDQAHRHNLGVIMDWVPAHFPKDEFGLARFDGHPLYEDSDPMRQEHRGWGTLAFDFGRPEVQSFLISNAFYFCDLFHIDGLRVDAVAAMLYLNYDREEGEWRPNIYGGTENLEAIDFLQNMNQTVLGQHPGVITVAEESTAWPNVTKPPTMQGLGFNFKWNMGWMNDTLEYFKTDPYFRKGVHNKLTFALTYAYSENFVLPISHDEVVHGKCSLLNKMPGEYDDKFAGLRSFYIYMMTHPGKKLTFMGSEFGQFIEWNEKKELDWLLLDYDRHRQVKDFVREVNHYYRSEPALWDTDDTFDGFQWIDADNSDDNVYTYMRLTRDGKKAIVVALNLSGQGFPQYDIGVPPGTKATVKLDTDQIAFGGTGLRSDVEYTIEEGYCNGRPQHITVPMPKQSALVLELEVQTCQEKNNA